MTSKLSLWPWKLHYFLIGAGAAPIIPFLPIIGKQMGISGSGIGLILALVQICGLIIKPSFGYLMDKYPSRKKSMMQMLMLIATLLLNCLRYTSPLDLTSEKSLNLTQCEPNIKVVVDSIIPPDPCLKHKLHSFFNFDHECTLTCQKNYNLPFKAIFDGSSATIENEHLTCKLKHSGLFFQFVVPPSYLSKSR